MTWGTSGGSPRKTYGTGGFQTPPQNDLPPASQRTASYSYLNSAGYCQLTLQKAEKTLGFQNMSDLAKVVAKLPEDDERFDTNERAALQEIARTPLNRLHELGIVRRSEKSRGVGIDCC